MTSNSCGGADAEDDGIASRIRECGTCGQTSDKVEWNSYINKGGRKQAVGEWCKACPVGAKVGQYCMHGHEIQQKAQKDQTFGQE
eukprot:7775157-Pyramimonas_sp.AAC.2